MVRDRKGETYQAPEQYCQGESVEYDISEQVYDEDYPPVHEYALDMLLDDIIECKDLDAVIREEPAYHGHEYVKGKFCLPVAEIKSEKSEESYGEYIE